MFMMRVVGTAGASCSIVPVDDTGSFTINSSTGYIRVSSSLDRETTPSYNLIVTVGIVVCYYIY